MSAYRQLFICCAMSALLCAVVLTRHLAPALHMWVGWCLGVNMGATFVFALCKRRGLIR